MSLQKWRTSSPLRGLGGLTDADGNIAQHIEYIPYGEVFVEERNNSFSTNDLFNAKELDNETGLYYYGARYLDPTGAMWLSVDPMWEKYMGISPYAYCLGNPVKLVDPDGREVEEGSFEDKMLTKIDKQAQKLIERHNKKIAKNKNVIENKERVRNLNQTREDIAAMRSTDEKFSIRKSSNGLDYAEYENGKEGGEYVIYLESKYIKNKAMIVHELRHCGQYKRGSLKKNKSNYGISHEIDAYRAQLSFSGKLNLPGILENADVESVISDLWNVVNKQSEVNQNNNMFNNVSKYNNVPTINVVPRIITKKVMDVTQDFIRRIGDGNGKRLYY